ncbi:uncharacterized protein SAPINGB_P004104 [Magnusiomyces paraingens]|uniref:HPP transmembrane region domain-containing protein n=1 Tax=Magnusiomyces paraingens TaxID=2606893 RepID=A0A5E8C071_9ASCO|nr:uncharacterized protein SAPINGB_P004104 [Saprochaete ingens]VVT54495.1 unnamed protein product [Saprochaete ingens]
MNRETSPPLTRADMTHDRQRTYRKFPRLHADKHLHKLNIDVDKHLNPYLVSSASFFQYLPNPVSRFFGYRDTRGNDVPLRRRGPPLRTKPLPDIVRSAWVLVATFSGLITTMCVMKYANTFNGNNKHHWTAPVIVPSWAAAAILIYNAVESPLGQPRNTFCGNLVSSFVGVAITKLFMLRAANEEHLWVCGALNVGVASIAMAVTKTVHPPGGAAALIAAVDPTIRGLGWFYIVVQIVTGLIMLSVACLFNNVQRRYPLYWWTPLTLRAVATPEVLEEEQKTTQQPQATTVTAPGAIVGESGGGPVERKLLMERNAARQPPEETVRAAPPGSSGSAATMYGVAAATAESTEERGGTALDLLPIKTAVDSLSSSLSSSSLNSSGSSNNYFANMGSVTSKHRRDRNAQQQEEEAEENTPQEYVGPAVTNDNRRLSHSLSHTLSRTITHVVSDTNYTQVVGTRPDDTGDLVLSGGTVLSRRPTRVSDVAVNGQQSDNQAEEEETIEPLTASEEEGPAVVVLPSHFMLPPGLELTEEEQVLLGRIQEQLKALAAARQNRSADDNV